MKINTKNFENFLDYVAAYHGLLLIECPCVNIGYKVFPTGEVMFYNIAVGDMASLHDDAWMAALSAQEL